MSHKHRSVDGEDSGSESNIIQVTDLMKQIEHLAGIRRKVRDGYYERPEVLARIASQLRRRLHDSR